MVSHPEKGFTFITMMIILALLGIMLPFLGYLLESVQFTSNYDALSIQMFFQFLRDEVIRSEDFQIKADTLYLEQNNDTTTIEHYENLVRRQVNGVGHEVYLMDVLDISFSQLPYGFRTTVTTLEGEQYDKTMVFYE